ncbi:MAG: hypothetical protein E6J65_28950 [Deltaproteobacteria bacterium]|nr:MAG: hypothetical protein E6J65_28950 [Deltaproteobacteria bacterium]
MLPASASVRTRTRSLHVPPSIPALTHPSAPPPTWRIALNFLDQNPHQPRSQMDEGALAELMASIRDHGLLQPITVRKVGTRDQVIAGHRRLEALEMALFALVENLQRDDLSLLDAALDLSRFQEALQLSTEGLTKRTGLELDRVKRLLRLARAPKVIQEACHQGVLVDETDEHGTVRLLPSGNPKHQRNRLDLMAALEVAKLHAHVLKSSPKKADERTARAIHRALSERWSFRRVQSFCRASIATVEPEAVVVEAATRSTPFPLFSDGEELLIRRSDLRNAAPEERTALRLLLTALVEELAS